MNAYMYECLREAHSLPQLYFSEAKLQLSIMPCLYVRAFSYNTDTPTFSNGESIGEAKEEKIQSAETPSPLVGGRSTNRCTLCKLLLHLLLSVTIALFMATIATECANQRIDIPVNSTHCRRRRILGRCRQMPQRRRLHHTPQIRIHNSTSGRTNSPPYWIRDKPLLKRFDVRIMPC